MSWSCSAWSDIVDKVCSDRQEIRIRRAPYFYSLKVVDFEAKAL
jgi:hypothetical protein